MSLNLSNLKPAKGSSKKKVRIGRGGKRGSYSGRGMKGQRARSGGRSGLKALGMKQMIQRIPKKRGFQSWKPKLPVINLADLEKKFNDGDIVDAKKVIQARLIDKKYKAYKVLGSGKLTKKLTVSAKAFSQGAKQAIEAAGGTIEVK